MPRNATTSRSGQRYYDWRSERYWSVTTILSGGVPKPALLPWGIKMVAEGAVEAVESGTLAGMVEQDREGAIRWLKGLPWAHRDKAADLGTAVPEASVFNRTERYAGTLDAIATIGGRTLVIDVKSGKGVYPETALQLAAYRWAEFVGVPDGSEQPMPPTVGAAVLHLTDQGDSFQHVASGRGAFP